MCGRFRAGCGGDGGGDDDDLLTSFSIDIDHDDAEDEGDRGDNRGHEDGSNDNNDADDVGDNADDDNIHSPFYFIAQSQEKARTVREITSTVLARAPKMCNFVEWRDKKIVYKR